MELDFINQGPALFDSYKQTFCELYKKIFSFLDINANYYTDVTIVDNNQIHSLNREYRHIDRPTDVISFAFLDDKNEIIPTDGSPISLGEIIISYEKAMEQSKEYGHSLEREMSFLFVHGMLHLLGYDHIEKEDEIVMFRLQDEILGGLNNGTKTID